MILAINTGSENNSIALYNPPKIDDEVVWQSYKTQSQELLPKIDKLLKSNKVKLSNLKAIAVFQGPGSYTGLRVGISVANTLAWSLDIPVVEIKIPKPKFQITNKFQNPNFNVKNQSTNQPASPLTSQGGPINQLSALEIAKRAQEIFIKENHSKFTEPVNPYYGVNKI